jgi:alkyl hydroperoxide reductase subunit AhpC
MGTPRSSLNPHIFRGLFIIDGKGVLRQITVNDLPVGRSVDEALRLVQAFQYTDEHGEGEWIPRVFTHGYDFSCVSVI